MKVLKFDKYEMVAQKLLEAYGKPKAAADAVASAGWTITLKGKSKKISMPKKLVYHLNAKPSKKKSKPPEL